MRIIFPNQHKNFFLHKCIFLLPWIIFFCSSLSPVFSFFMAKIFRLPGPQFFLGISLYGIKRIYLWQFFTYPLVNSFTTAFSASFLVKNALIAVVLRHLLKTFETNLGSRIVCIFLITNTILTGILSWGLMLATKSFNIFMGPIFLIIALLNIHVSLFPNQIVKLRIAFPLIKIKWLFLLTFGFILIYYISNRNFINLFGLLISFCVSILFCLFLRIPNPFFKDLSLKEKIKKVKIKVIKKNKN